MNSSNKGLIILVIILGLLVVGLSGYIVYDKVLKYNSKEEMNSNKENLLTEAEAKVILKDLEEKYYEYYRVKNAETYCGDLDRNDNLSFGSNETMNLRIYNSSKTFKTISELKDYLSNIMVNDLMPKNFDNGVSYIEKDGKLYCQSSQKGLDGFRDYDKETEYNIVSIKSDTIVSNVLLWALYMGDEDSIKRDAKITIVKNESGKWLVSNYEIMPLQ